MGRRREAFGRENRLNQSPVTPSRFWGAALPARGELTFQLLAALRAAPVFSPGEWRCAQCYTISMTTNTAKLLEEALKLPSEARAALAGSLLDSLDDTVDPNAEAAWEAEIARRLKDLDDGKVRPVPWSEARRAILKR